ncbi:hypothetical protein COCSUDRAFT_59064 [Coccomyxa subellipsoidea C-169]|uniref:Uncharacterized protein n=1 Tax=Coccomyxa subellipsoidea (strain C-169) TaxID=574566 RepID=I0Z7B8_COCSC|nr:hypothetical protein COCSUDRAFT_59064 [Coccomyxa subellipsoidea C-169]EIE26537.1 hypothetical protein COCSUDRAFT_59064 [Coccomyxa subellipsoidea C-169]|eukprot:XP_005651081.1 hypothetical protein COCSUDRAFT_59064 [Coccomyxa subellipsoidea C-169]
MCASAAAAAAPPDPELHDKHASIKTGSSLCARALPGRAGPGAPEGSSYGTGAARTQGRLLAIAGDTTPPNYT